MASDNIARLKQLASIRNTSIEGVVTKAIVLPIIAFFDQISQVIAAIFGLITEPLGVAGVALGDLVDALIGGAANIIGVGATASAQGTEPFGILGFIVGIAVVGGGAYVAMLVFSTEETADSPLTAFTGIDLPFVGADEEE